MITRKDKRKLEGNTNYFFKFLKIKEHFFKSMGLWLKKVTDHRHQSYKKYDTEVILFMMILKNAFNFKSMRSMTDDSIKIWLLRIWNGPWVLSWKNCLITIR